MEVDEKVDLSQSGLRGGQRNGMNGGGVVGVSDNAMESKNVVSGSVEGVEVLALTQTHMAVHSEHQLLIEDLEIRKRANELIIPTNDEHVKARLEEIGEPIIFFAETKPMRRQRLRLELARRGLTEGMPKEVRELGVVAMNEEERGPKRPFETPGLPFLSTARLALLHDSIPRSHARLQSLQQRQNYYAHMTDSEWSLKTQRDDLYFQPLATCASSISVVGDARPLTSIAFNHNGSQLATSSWNPLCKIWNTTSGAEMAVLKGHTERVIDVAFAPAAIASQASPIHIATAATDKTIRLWNGLQSGEAVATLKGHDDRVNILAWHPTGSHLFASSHDCTWSMWDVATQTLLLRQDGHSRAVFGLGLHPDGAVLATGSVDASIRIWDVRSGLPLHTFLGHVRQVLAVDWHPDGFLLASASEDNTVRIWDLRTRKLVYTIPAHQGLVSDVKWAPHHGKFLVSSGNDKYAKIWRSDTFTHVCSLSGHDSRVTSVDISPAASQSYLDLLSSHSPLSQDPDFSLPPVSIATTGADRTWKLWNP